MLDRILRDVEPRHADTRHHAAEIVEEKALGTADIEHAVARRPARSGRGAARRWAPSGRRSDSRHSPGRDPRRSTPPEALGDIALGRHRRLAGGDVPSCPRVAVEEIDLSACSSAPKAARVARSPSSKGVKAKPGSARDSAAMSYRRWVMGPLRGRVGHRHLVGHQARIAFTTSAKDRLSPVATLKRPVARARMRPAMSPATSST